MNRNMIQWLLWLVCIFVVVGEVLGCPPLGEPPRALIDGLEEKYEFSATGVKVIFSGSAGDDGCIMNLEWQFPSGMTLVAEPTANCQSCGTGCLENGTGACNLTSCTFGATGKYTITFTVTDDDDMTDSATCHIYISNVVSVEWETYPDDVVATPVDHGPNIDIDADVHPCQPPGSTAKRIFPGKKVYNDTLAERNMRRKVLAKVTISNTFTDIPDPGFPVRIDLYDVDDPSANDYGLPEAQCTAPLDCDDPNHSAFSSFEDNKGGMDCRFCFTNGWDCDCGYVASGSDDVGIVMWTSHLPGNNVRVVVSTAKEIMNQDDPWDEVTWERVDSDSGAGLPSQVERSDMLTSWRKLHIERDYMAPVPSTGAEKNRITGTADSYTYDGVSKTEIDLGQDMPGHFDDEDQFEGGWYFAFPNWYQVISYVDSWWDDEIIVQGDPAGDGALMAYTLFDDDDQDLLDSPYYVTLGATEINAFRQAYIEPDYLPDSYSDEVSFNLNLTWTEQVFIIDFDEEQDVWSEPDFWACLMTACYQCEYSADQDADLFGVGGYVPIADTDSKGGVVPENDDNVGAIFLEVVINENAWLWSEQKTVAHEIGHTGGPGECTNPCIMNPDCSGGACGTSFCNECLASFRKYETWSTTNEN